jgi:hypothetical protein
MNTLTLTDEQLTFLYEAMSNYQDASDSHTFYDEESDTEETNEDRFFTIYNSIMDKV